MKLIDQDAADLVSIWYRHYKHQVLPVAGGLLDQTNFYVEAMTYIEGLMNG